MSLLLQLIWDGLVLGVVYSIVSLGYALNYSLNVNNFAHGTMVTLGGYTAFLLLTELRLPLGLAFLLTLPVGALAGWAVYMVTVKATLKGRPTISVIAATLALGLIIENTILLLHGSDSFSIRSLVIASRTFNVVGLTITNIQLIVVGAGWAVTVVLAFLLQRSTLGLRLRAVADDQLAAGTMGFSKLGAMSAALLISGAAAASAGILTCLDYDLSSYSGTGFLMTSYTATIIGGAYNLWRVALAAVLLGIIENLVTGYLSTEYRSASVFAVLIIVLLVKKEGFAKTGMLRGI